MTIYKEMKYHGGRRQIETLAEGQVGEYKWTVLSLGTHPCGYVAVPENHPFYEKHYWEIDDQIEVHGGLTFGGRLQGSNDYWFGWDYAHAGDYTGYATFGTNDEKRWTTQEIVDECLKVIKQFQKYEKAEVQPNFKLTHQGKIPIDQYKARQGFIAKPSPDESYHLVKIIGGQLYDFSTRDYVNDTPWFAYEPIEIVVEIKKGNK